MYIEEEAKRKLEDRSWNYNKTETGKINYDQIKKIYLNRINLDILPKRKYTNRNFVNCIDSSVN